MKKRLRKKFNLGEFRELGFDLTFSMRDGIELGADGINPTFFDRFTDFIEARDCGFGGGCGRKWNGFVMYIGRAMCGSVSAANRDDIRAYLIHDPDVLRDTVAAGPLRDANYGWEPRGKLDYRRRRHLGHIDWKLAAVENINDQIMQASKRGNS